MINVISAACFYFKNICLTSVKYCFVCLIATAAAALAMLIIHGFKVCPLASLFIALEGRYGPGLWRAKVNNGTDIVQLFFAMSTIETKKKEKEGKMQSKFDAGEAAATAAA